MNILIFIFNFLFFCSLISEENGIYLIIILVLFSYTIKKFQKNFELSWGKAIDKNNLLVWQRFSVGEEWLTVIDLPTKEPKLFTYDEAISIVSDYGDIDNWRLPTIEELKTIIKFKKNKIVFPTNKDDFYWSSSIVDNINSEDIIKIKGICFKTEKETQKNGKELGYVRLVSELTRKEYEKEMKKTSAYEKLFFLSFKELAKIIFILLIIGFFISFFKTENDDKNKKDEKDKVTISNHVPKGNILINGKFVVDEVLSSVNDISDEDGLGDFNYQWLRNGKEIENETKNTYQLSESDVDKKISLSISYLDGEGTNEIVISNETTCEKKINHAPIGELLISGPVVIGQVIFVENTISDEDGVGDLEYKWLRNGKEIDGAINKFYKIIETDINQMITIDVSYIDGQGKKEKISNNIFPTISTHSSDGNDILTGSNSNDTIEGLAGDDKINGKLGSDILSGGLGADTFKYDSVNDSGVKSLYRDVIVDFSSYEDDRIDLSDISKDVPLHFIGNRSFDKKDATGEIRFDSTNHILYISTNSDNKPEFSIEIKNFNNLSIDHLILK